MWERVELFKLHIVVSVSLSYLLSWAKDLIPDSFFRHGEEIQHHFFFKSDSSGLCRGLESVSAGTEREAGALTHRFLPPVGNVESPTSLHVSGLWEESGAKKKTGT